MIKARSLERREVRDIEVFAGVGVVHRATGLAAKNGAATGLIDNAELRAGRGNRGALVVVRQKAERVEPYGCVNRLGREGRRRDGKKADDQEGDLNTEVAGDGRAEKMAAPDSHRFVFLLQSFGSKADLTFLITEAAQGKMPDAISRAACAPAPRRVLSRS